MLKSSLCYYSSAYMLVKGTVTVSKRAVADANENNANEKVILKIAEYLLMTKVKLTI